jgi:hypothetical protein
MNADYVARICADRTTRLAMAFPVDIQFVKRAETKLGRKLPLGYVAKMCRDNGGGVSAGPDYWYLYPIFDDSDRKRLKRTCNDIIRETASAREWPGFPTNTLAIGHNGDGDVLVLLAEGNTDRYADDVYWWDHETGDLNKVADAFEEMSGDGDCGDR